MEFGTEVLLLLQDEVALACMYASLCCPLTFALIFVESTGIRISPLDFDTWGGGGKRWMVDT